ncbi:MAG TPA: UDP-N-acetylmuramate dehydrogenase [Anaerolineae bacterium]|nr:UDP-N-acetylmuramate dehydrogenase [Anaerolineae bacterium]
MIQSENNIPLAPYTHYNIGGTAREVYFPADTSELLELFGEFTKNGTDYYILGGGSNVLVGDGYFDGAVIITTSMNHFEPLQYHITCGAGLQSSRIAEIALEHSKTGLEFLYLLPGTIGGALAGNARYDNKDVSDVLLRLVAVHPEKGINTYTVEELDFEYKYNSISREGWLICEASLTWADGDPAIIKKSMDDIQKKRTRSKQFDLPSCGCIFKNDYRNNIQAGRLIESLGLKGLAVGGAQVAPFHANFIINTGNATALDVLELIEQLENIVFEKTGIKLEREVQILGTI